MREAGTAATWNVAKVMTILGVFLLVLFLAIGGWKLYGRTRHAGTWPATTAEIAWAGEMCQMAFKQGKSWRDADVIPCGDVDAYKAERSDQTLRATPGPFVTVAYEAGGSRREVLASAYAVPADATAAGARAPIFVDPADPMVFDRAIDARDYREFAIIAAMGVVALVACSLLGRAIGRLNARSAAKRAPGAA